MSLSGGLSGTEPASRDVDGTWAEGVDCGAQDTEPCDKGLNHVCENELCEQEVACGGRDFKVVCGRCQMSGPKCRGSRMEISSGLCRSEK